MICALSTIHHPLSGQPFFLSPVQWLAARGGPPVSLKRFDLLAKEMLIPGGFFTPGISVSMKGLKRVTGGAFQFYFSFTMTYPSIY
jgi:hypothetical protein